MFSSIYLILLNAFYVFLCHIMLLTLTVLLLLFADKCSTVKEKIRNPEIGKSTF